MENEHVKIKYRYTGDLVKEERINAKFCWSQNQVVNIFTKALKMDTSSKLKEETGNNDCLA